MAHLLGNGIPTQPPPLMEDSSQRLAVDCTQKGSFSYVQDGASFLHGRLAAVHACRLWFTKPGQIRANSSPNGHATTCRGSGGYSHLDWRTRFQQAGCYKVC